MITMSKTLLDARAGADNAGEFAADADLQLRFAGQISASDAAAWAKKRPSKGRLTALLDLPEAARLDVKAWLKALQPDVVELRAPAWSAAGMAAIGWPSGQDALVRTVQTLATAGVATRLALHVSSLTVGELTPQRLAALSQLAGGSALTFALRPVLGEHAPALHQLARATAELVRAGAQLAASKLWPACALPLGLDGEATFPSERAAARQEFTAACAGCEARELGRCDGMAADLLAASFKDGGAWHGWSTWQEARTATLEVPEPKDAVEAIELRLRARRVWQGAVPPEAAAAFAAAVPASLHVLTGEEIPAEAANPFDVEAEKGAQRLLYVAAEAEDATAAHEAQLASVDPDEDIANAAHRQLGELFGYPTCCTDSYIAALPARVADEYQGVSPLAFAALQAARDSETFDNRLDFASPLSDAYLLTYRPCRYDCAESLARVAAVEAEMAKTAPGRLNSLAATRAQAALVFADGTEIPLSGTVRADGGLDAPRPLGLDTASDSPRSRSARDAWAAIAEAVTAGVALVATEPFAGLGGVSILSADGSRTALTIAGGNAHAEFPRLIVFKA